MASKEILTKSIGEDSEAPKDCTFNICDYIEESVEKNKTLEDVFKLYKKYTGYKGDYDQNTFSIKLRDAIVEYNLGECITYFKEKSTTFCAYEFSREESELLAILLACRTSTKTTKKNDYNYSILNPLLKGDSGISNLLNYMQNFKDYIKKLYQ